MATTAATSTTSENIKNLQAQVDKYNALLKDYNTDAATDEELKKRAESEYTPIYNANVAEQEAIKQSAGTTLSNYLSALERQHAKNQESANRNYDNQRVTANNTMLARGLNNSSLALATLNHVEDERNRALNDLIAEYTASQNAAQSQYNDTVTAADRAIARLKSDLATNIDARITALREADQSRVMNATQAQNSLTQYLTSLLLQIEEMRHAQQQYEDSQKKKSSSSSSSSKKATTTTTTQSKTPTNTGSDLESKYNSSSSSSGSGSKILDALKVVGSAAATAAGSLALNKAGTALKNLFNKK